MIKAMGERVALNTKTLKKITLISSFEEAVSV